MLAAFEYHENAEEDIKKYLEKDLQGITDLLAVLEELEANPDCRDVLLEKDLDFEASSGYTLNAKPFAILWKVVQGKSRDIWRLKSWDPADKLLKYRILYAYFRPRYAGASPKFVVLAVIHRDEYNYQIDHPITVRVKNDYDDL